MVCRQEVVCKQDMVLICDSCKTQKLFLASVAVVILLSCISYSCFCICFCICFFSCICASSAMSNSCRDLMMYLCVGG